MPDAKPKFTPGPWRVETSLRGTLCVTSPDTWICGELACENHTRIDSLETEANARLIAAAPKMHEALREALPYVEKAANTLPTQPAGIARQHRAQEILERIVKVLEQAEGPVMTRRERLEQFIADWLTPGCDYWQRQFEPRLGYGGGGRKLKLSELTDECLEDIAADIVHAFWRMRRDNRRSRAAYAAHAAREAAQ